ncbi:hypothetical protein ACGE0T_04675 [Parabacteroides sp. APC149_11_2_Y6]
MKNALTYLFVVFLAALVFYGGAGVNLVTYCCTDCSSEGVTALLESKCCDIHHHHHCVPEKGEMSPCCHSGDGDCCSMERISFDWSSFHSSDINLQPVVTDLLYSDSFLSVLPLVSELKEPFYADRTGPSWVCPRIYLSLLTTLLI